MFNPSCSSDFVFFTQLLSFFSFGSVNSCVQHGYRLGTYFSKGNPYTTTETQVRRQVVSFCIGLI